jgi:hypothetical protein
MTARGTPFEAGVRPGLLGRIGLFQQAPHGAIDFAVGINEYSITAHSASSDCGWQRQSWQFYLVGAHYISDLVAAGL